jgi:hypothetical protein
MCAPLPHMAPAPPPTWPPHGPRPAPHMAPTMFLPQQVLMHDVTKDSEQWPRAVREAPCPGLPVSHFVIGFIHPPKAVCLIFLYHHPTLAFQLYSRAAVAKLVGRGQQEQQQPGCCITDNTHQTLCQPLLGVNCFQPGVSWCRLHVQVFDLIHDPRPLLLSSLFKQQPAAQPFQLPPVITRPGQCTPAAHLPHLLPITQTHSPSLQVPSPRKTLPSTQPVPSGAGT